MDAESIKDLFAAFGPVRLNRMFGGQGIYAGDTIIAIEAYGEIWLKTDGQSRPLFEKAGSAPFTYAKKVGQQTIMSYWRLPDSAVDDPDAVAEWARLALAAARRMGKVAKRGKKRSWG